MKTGSVSRYAYSIPENTYVAKRDRIARAPVERLGMDYYTVAKRNAISVTRSKILSGSQPGGVVSLLLARRCRHAIQAPLQQKTLTGAILRCSPCQRRVLCCLFVQTAAMGHSSLCWRHPGVAMQRVSRAF